MYKRQAYAGVAIENSMLGAAHAAANPLTAHCGLVHGQAVGLMIPHVITYNKVEPEIREIYAELYKGDLAGRVLELMTMLGMPQNITDLSHDSPLINTMAEEAANQWTAGFNPREVDPENFKALYQAAIG